jgi:hypothetical protein
MFLWGCIAFIFALTFFFVLSQIVVPMVFGTKLFPFFQTKRRQLEVDISEIKEELDAEALAEEKARLQRQLDKKREPPKK